MTSETANDKDRQPAAGESTRKYYARPEKPEAPRLKTVDEDQRPFALVNILMMAGCVLLIVLGFCLMSGGGSSVEGGFNPDIFSTRRIVVGPTIAFLGFLLMAFAIIYQPASRRAKK